MSNQSENRSVKEHFALPQPEGGKEAFRYVRVEEIKTTFFPPSPDDSRLFTPGQFVWVCKSKGLRKNRKDPVEENSRDDDSSDHYCPPEKPPLHRLELFLRARVIEQEGERMRVQYPKGSTYACQICNLIPVLETQKSLVLVAAETSDYRRCCVVHTLPDENFMEIGCDYGITTDRIRSRGTDQSEKRKLWGVDKSPESIGIAKERYPQVPFFECDVLDSPKSEWPKELQDAQPHVIAVDINGNRELEAVCQCLKVLFGAYQPRLIIVKSRAVHAKVPLFSN